MSDETPRPGDIEEDIQPQPEADPQIEPQTGQGGDAPAGAEGETSPQQHIEALQAETADLKDKLLRSLAEVDNVRKRAVREAADARVYAIEKFAGDLLSVADNLSRALDALPEDDRAALSQAGQGLLGGIEMTHKELHTVLARHGVKEVEAAPGADFDPNLHQAVTQVPSQQPAGSIAQTFQSGWKIGDRTLRAAMVAVSTGPADS